MTPFNAIIRAEGSKGGLRITIPTNIVAQMRATGWQPPGWIRLHVDDYDPVFVMGRYPVSRPSVTCTLPVWAFPSLRAGQEVQARVEDPTPFRASGSMEVTPNAIDWLQLLDDTYFPTQTGEMLTIWSRHEEPFVLKRVADDLSFWWLLGYYQAEGSKSENAPDWTLATNNPFQLAEVPRALEKLGIPRERQYMEILQSEKEPDPLREGRFHELVAIRCASTRMRPGRGYGACVLHVSKSQPLLRFFKAMLARVFAPDWVWPSKEAARAYALGWLDGDGSITLDRRSNNIMLALAGTVEEQTQTLAALQYGFGWAVAAPAYALNCTHICMRLDHAAALALAGGFKHTMSRARLLWALFQRTIQEPKHFVKGRTLTDVEGYATAHMLVHEDLRHECARLQRLSLWRQGFNIGEKGHHYPLR